MVFSPHATIGPIERFMTEDHVRIDRLLEAAERGDGAVEPMAYARFRQDLLRHIAMEEKVLLPFARSRRAGVPLSIAAALRADHGRIAKMLARAPTADVVASLCALLAEHNPLEEGPGGLYALCDALAGSAADAEAVVERLRAQPRVPLAPLPEAADADRR